MQAPQDRYVQVGEVRTRFWSLGDEGSALVLIHGFGLSLEYWSRNIHVLAQRHRVYALDLVGHGRSDKPAAPYSLSYFAQFVHDFLDTQSIDRTSLVGNSMGGGIALQFALRFPERVEKLVLVSPEGLGKEVALVLRLMTLPLVGELLTRPNRREATLVVNLVFHDPSLAPDEMVDRQHELSALPGAQEAKLAVLRSLGTLGGARSEAWHPIVDNLSRITAPTLVIWGKQDRILPVAHAQVAKERMPDVRVHIFDPCGHVAQMERPKEFNELVLEFLAGCGSGA